MKLIRGEPFPYDTGVATSITTYRQESYFIKKTDTLVTSLVSEVDSLRAQLELLRRLYQVEQEKNRVANQHIKDQAESLKTLSTTYDRLNHEAQKPKNKWLFFGGCVAASVILKSLFSR